jgi:3-isopropylmalate/(R)-2-methylmalate dehydratase small subunit
VVDEETWSRLAAHPGEEVTIDLDQCELRFGNHVTHFDVEPFAQRCLMDGVDQLGWIKNRLPDVEAFEWRHDL